MDTIKITNKKNTLMVAHRGVSGIERENTAAAFVAAGNRTYAGIECDTRRTKDGHFVIMHDSKTDRVAGDHLVVAESTLEELQAIVLFDKDDTKGRTDLRVPTLQNYISICKKYEKISVLELKGAMSHEDLSALCAVIDSYEYMDKVIFIAFDFDTIVRLREIRPETTVQFLTSTFDEDLIERLVSHKFDLDIYFEALTEENIALCHDNGITVNCWTVDDPAVAEKLISWGVDQITSNILE